MAAAPIYANVRDPERAQAIAAARASASTAEVANRFGISPSQVNAIVHRVKATKTYHLFLEDRDGTRQPIGTVITHKGFTAACVAAFRTYGEYFRNIGVPGWRITDPNGGCNTLETVRKIAARTADVTPVAKGELL